MTLRPFILTALLLALPVLAHTAQPPIYMQEAGGLAVYMEVTEVGRPNTAWKGPAPKPGDTHHIVFLLRNSRTGQAETVKEIKFRMFAPSGQQVVFTTVPPFIAKGITTYGQFFPLSEKGEYVLSVGFVHQGKEESVKFSFIR